LIAHFASAAHFAIFHHLTAIFALDIAACHTYQTQVSDAADHIVSSTRNAGANHHLSHHASLSHARSVHVIICLASRVMFTQGMNAQTISAHI